MSGKPRKLTWLSNFDLQIAKVLRHPAVTVALSPTATGKGTGSHSSRMSTPEVRRCDLISKVSPSFAPAVNSSVPPVNQSVA